MNSLTEQRLIQNEVVCKQMNQKASNLLGGVLPPLKPISFVCECSAENCKEHIELVASSYKALHQNPKRYIVKPEHQTEQVERVAERYADFYVVEKF